MLIRASRVPFSELEVEVVVCDVWEPVVKLLLDVEVSAVEVDCEVVETCFPVNAA